MASDRHPHVRRRRRLRHDRRVLLMALAAGLPAVIVSLALLWFGDHSPKVRWTLTVLTLSIWSGMAFSLRQHVVFPLHTLSNLLAGLREGDSSIRARGADVSDPLGEVILEANLLAQTLRDQRLDALEATALLRKVMAEIDVAVFTFDAEERLRLVNRAGERLLGQPIERLLNSPATDLRLVTCLRDDTPPVVEMAFPGGSGRFEVRRTQFRQGGLPHHLLVLSDVSRSLRDEERQAWQRLMRVLGHEINNSLAPIKSIAGSLEHLLANDALPADWQSDARRGLSVIAARSEALARFTATYARLAKLPRPKFASLAIGTLIRRVVNLEARLPVAIQSATDVMLDGDADQLEQVLINLIRNAVDAALQAGGGVSIGWKAGEGWLDLWIDDEGPGLPATTNLFVPFFTTKPGGSGIGLALSRQIAEGHGGSLRLENRLQRRGCTARLRLPLRHAEAARTNGAAEVVVRQG
jgi:nitrogen fixation/metabolism regulation signal transduction histidine kinase